MEGGKGASAKADRAGGPRPEPVAQSQPKALIPCAHGVIREQGWCEPCFRKEQRKRWGNSLYDYCDLLGRANG